MLRTVCDLFFFLPPSLPPCLPPSPSCFCYFPRFMCFSAADVPLLACTYTSLILSSTIDSTGFLFLHVFGWYDLLIFGLFSYISMPDLLVCLLVFPFSIRSHPYISLPCRCGSFVAIFVGLVSTRTGSLLTCLFPSFSVFALWLLVVRCLAAPSCPEQSRKTTIRNRQLITINTCEQVGMLVVDYCLRI